MPKSPTDVGSNNWFVESTTGVRIPGPGLGTFDTKGSGDGRGMRAVKAGILAGYRHIDTAALYDCEEEVGEGIRASGVSREEIFVCTKLLVSESKRTFVVWKKFSKLMFTSAGSTIMRLTM
jgi:diketogulonate reductase-like aldo/keto reductase